MIVRKLSTGAHSRAVKYAVCNDASETGSKAEEIARFDSLELAVLVLRYLSCAALDKTDTYRAREAIKKAAAPAVVSNGQPLK